MKIPEDKKGHMLGYKGCGNPSDQGDQVGDDDGRQAAVVVAEYDDGSESSQFFSFRDEGNYQIWKSPEPSKEKHPRHSAKEEDWLFQKSLKDY